MRDMLQATTEEMARAGVGMLNQVDFTASFASPVFFVKNKAKFRLVCDYKDLNAVTTDDIYPLPHMDYIFENLGNSNGTGNQPCYFSILDLKSGYWQIPLEEAAQKLAAIMLPFGIFRFICLPFGLKNAPAFFQRYMDKVLKDGLGNYVFVYIDDIVIFSDTFANHLEHLNLVLGFLKECNLKANIEKCHFCLSQLRVLGKIVSKDGLATDHDLIKAMVEFPSPGNDTGNLAKKKLKRFLAMLSYYRGHIKDFGPQTALLSTLLKEDVFWDKNSWTVEHEKAFRLLKQLMIEAPVLAFPDMSKPFLLQSDASKVGAGAVLYQIGADEMRCVVSYASWLFSDTQRRYNTTEREMLGLILAVRKWKPFFYHTKFFAETDHEPLVGYMKLDDPYGKISRWAAELAQFSFQIKYIKGETNIPSDTLSRTGEEIDLLESVFSCTEEDGKFLASHRPSKVLSKAFTEENIDLFTCVESDENDNIFINSLCFSTPSDQEWIIAQRSDEEFGPYMTWLEKGSLPEDDIEAKIVAGRKKFFALNSAGILVYNSSGEDGLFRKCVPKKFRKIILSECHDSLWSGGHLGRDKTKDKLRSTHYFPRMEQYTDIWIKTCPICLATKRKHPSKLPIPLGSIATSHTWELLSIDLWESGVLSDRGHKYVMTVIDSFSKYAFAIPIKDKRAETIAKKLFKHVFCIFGYPDRIHSDNGLEFCNQILTALCVQLGIDKTHTTAYHPQGNAHAERIHQFFKNALSSYVGRDQRDWDLLIPSLIAIYLNTVHTSLGGFSPSQLMFGRQMFLANSPGEKEIPSPVMTTNEFGVKLKLALDRAQELVQDIIKDKKFKNLKPTLGKFILSYNVGDKVGLQVEAIPVGVKSRKLVPRFSGPYTVTKAAHDGKVLHLADINGKVRKVPVSIQKVKPWPDRQTLLEQFENYEFLRNSLLYKKKFVPASTSTTTVIIPEVVVPEVLKKTVSKDIIKDTLIDDDMDEDIFGNPYSESDLRDRRVEYEDDDYDVMGNLIHHSTQFIKDKIAKKVDLVSNSMFIIETVDYFSTRSISSKTTNLTTTKFYVEQEILYADINNSNNNNSKICTNLILI